MDKKSIKQILLEQREEISKIFNQKIIDREITAKAQKSLISDLIKVITGVRRCGKSVLAHLLLREKNYGYVNFDDERLMRVEPKDMNDFLEVFKEINPNLRYILLDEIQNVKGWELFVNRLKRLGYDIIVTGSNSKLLSKELATHLTGRHISLELFPFSFREFLNYKNKEYKLEDLYIAEKKGEIKNLFNEYLKYGGFPEVIKNEVDETKVQYLKDLYDRIITRDVISRFNIRYIKDLKEIAFYLTSNFSSRISYNKIRNIFSIKSVHTVKNYISYLEESYLISQLNTFSFKVKNQLMQPKKSYVIDAGIINAIGTRFTPDYGKIMENFVFVDLLRNKENKEIFFYSDSYHHEVDFIVKQGLNIEQIIQVCYNIEDNDTKKREIRSAIIVSQRLKCENIIVITGDYENEENVKWQNIERKIKFVPLWKWFLFK